MAFNSTSSTLPLILPNLLSLNFKSSFTSFAPSLHGLTLPLSLDDALRLAHIAGYIFATGIAVLVSNVIYNYFFHPLAQVPGPFWASVSSLWLLRCFRSGEMERRELDLHARYGKIVRVAPGRVSVADPRYLGAVMKVPGGESVFGCGLKKEERERIAGAYNENSARRLEPYIDKRILEVLGVFDQRFLRGYQPCDFAQWSQFMSFDITSDIVFGKRFGCVKNGGDVKGVIKSTEEKWKDREYFSRLPTWVQRIPLMRWWMRSAPQVRRSIATMLKFRDRVLGRRYDEYGMKKRTDLLNYFLLTENPDGTPISLLDTKHASLTAFASGCSTTGTLIRKLLFYVIEDPRIHKKLLYELDKAAHDRSTRGIPPYSKIHDLHYLAAIIHETLRLAPPVATQITRTVGPAGLNVLGHYLPQGTVVGMNAYVLGRDKMLYGPDAETFRPERWLEADVETLELWERVGFAFGSGARACLGKSIALMGIYKITAVLFRHFLFSVSGPPPGINIYRKETNFGAVRGEGWWVKMRRREQAEEEWKQLDLFFSRHIVAEEHKDIQL